jgi:hypothetical protein
MRSKRFELTGSDGDEIMTTHSNTVGALIAGMFVCLAAGAPAIAQETLLKDCASEISTYCSKVTAGQDRIVACLISYEDKISPRCRLTTYIASGNLDERMKALRGFAKICSADILQYCAKVQAGGGRIYDCLKKNQATLTDDCRKNVPQFEKILAD